MTLVEFTCKWSGNYSEEQIRTYEVLHGDNRELWPKTADSSLILIDLHSITRVNPSDDDGYTVVEVNSNRAFNVLADFEELKKFLGYMGVNIVKYAV